jgi:hypothetical protein
MHTPLPAVATAVQLLPASNTVGHSAAQLGMAAVRSIILLAGAGDARHTSATHGGQQAANMSAIIGVVKDAVHVQQACRCNATGCVAAAAAVHQVLLLLLLIMRQLLLLVVRLLLLLIVGRNRFCCLLCVSYCYWLCVCCCC